MPFEHWHTSILTSGWLKLYSAQMWPRRWDSLFPTSQSRATIPSWKGRPPALASLSSVLQKLYSRQAWPRIWVFLPLLSSYSRAEASLQVGQAENSRPPSPPPSTLIKQRFYTRRKKPRNAGSTAPTLCLIQSRVLVWEKRATVPATSPRTKTQRVFLEQSHARRMKDSVSVSNGTDFI